LPTPIAGALARLHVHQETEMLFESHPSFHAALVAERRRELQRRMDATRLRREAKRFRHRHRG
jgi:hypothetical protein